MSTKVTLAAILVALAAAPSSAAVNFGFQLSLGADGDTRSVRYDCAGPEPLTVVYINAHPNYLAVIPIEGSDIVFVNVVSASGAKYEAGSYVWWNKGADATLHDVTEGLDAAPVLSCTEHLQIP